MRVILFSLAIWVVGLAVEAGAQCPSPAGAYYGSATAYAPYGAYYAPYPAYAPFRAPWPSYPTWSSTAPVPRYGTQYGTQSSYFRGAVGPGAPPGGTFFGGYDYQVTYPPNWFGGYWGGW